MRNGSLLGTFSSQGIWASPAPLSLRSGPLWCISSPEPPLAVRSVLMTKQSRTGVTPHCPGERYIYRGQLWQTGRQLSGFSMAKVTDKSWEPKTTSTKRWKKRKALSQPGSGGKVRWPYPSSSSSFPFIPSAPPPPQINLPQPGTHLLLTPPPIPPTLLPTNELWAHRCLNRWWRYIRR